MAQERDGGERVGLRRGCRGSFQSQSPSDASGQQAGFLIGDPIGRRSPETYPPQHQALQRKKKSRADSYGGRKRDRAIRRPLVCDNCGRTSEGLYAAREATETPHIAQPSEEAPDAQ